MTNKLDYNTQRKQLVLPEYGRHIQKMVQYVMQIEDREKRNEQVMAVITVMGNLNPYLRDVHEFKHKLWDHVQLISDFEINIDSPYPLPSRESFQEKPKPIPYSTTPIKVMHYGRNIENMLKAIAEREEGAEKQAMIATVAYYMKKQYIAWNKESVNDELIFRDIKELSGGRINIDTTTKIVDLQNEIYFQHNQTSTDISKGNSNGNHENNNNHSRKKNNHKTNSNTKKKKHKKNSNKQ